MFEYYLIRSKGIKSNPGREMRTGTGIRNQNARVNGCKPDKQDIKLKEIIT